jgi:hypothetical protein
MGFFLYDRIDWIIASPRLDFGDWTVVRCPALPQGQTTLLCFNFPISSALKPNSASTSSVCSPNSGGRTAILLGVRDSVTGWLSATSIGGSRYPVPGLLIPRQCLRLPAAVALLDSPGRDPEHPRRGDGINSPPLPPGDFVAKAMVVAVMRPAQRDCELVADLAPHCAVLGEPNVMGISRASPTHQTRLRRHKLEVHFVSMPARLADREHAFIDFARRGASFNVSLNRRGIFTDRVWDDRWRSRLLHRGFDLSRASPWRSGLTAAVGAEGG